MGLVTHHPPPALAGYVDCFWFWKRDAATHVCECVLPTGTSELVVPIHNDGRGPTVCGARSKPFVMDTQQPVTVLGVHFRPGGASPFLNIPASELHNVDVPLEDLWGSSSNELQERLLVARSSMEMFEVLARRLLDRVQGRCMRHPAVEFALRQMDARPNAFTVGDLVERVGLSHRRFNQVFKERVGMTPKLLDRVLRFQDVLRRIDMTPVGDWAGMALECGYYDQAHLIHDFQDFAGMSPTAYLLRRSGHLNHVPVVD